MAGLPVVASTATTATTAITVASTATTVVTSTTTTTTTVSAAAFIATAATATAVLLGPAFFGFVDTEVATQQVSSVQLFDCFTSEFVVSKSNKCESAWAVGFAVEGNEEVFNGSVVLKGVANVLVFSREGQIAEVEFHGLVSNESVGRTGISPANAFGS
jgi:hypothetical protein